MELFLISLILVIGMATVDIRESRPDAGDALDSDQDRPYGVHG